MAVLDPMEWRGHQASNAKPVVVPKVIFVVVDVSVPGGDVELGVSPPSAAQPATIIAEIKTTTVQDRRFELLMIPLLDIRVPFTISEQIVKWWS